MEKKEFIQYISVDNKFGYKNKEHHIKSKFIETFNEIINHNKLHFNEVSWKQKLFNYLNDIQSPPKCQNINCDKNVKYHPNPSRYLMFCSNKCAQSSEEIINTKKKTTLNNHGVEYPTQSGAIKDKIKKSLLKNYGKKLDNINNKRKETNFQKFGVDNYSKTKEFREKMRTRHFDKTRNNFSKILGVEDKSIGNPIAKQKNWNSLFSPVA